LFCRGIWKQDIRYATNIPQQSLDKILKLLEQRLLIKTVRSIGSKTKKLYMLYDIMPAKEITGGPWYTDQEFDHEFVAALSSFILQFIQSQKMVDAPTINIRVKKSGISTVELTLDELELVLQTLIYDGKIEEVRIYIAIIQVTYSSIPLYIDRYRVLF
jgi:DNA-directed RNA polymerase III subunit RPC6